MTKDELRDEDPQRWTYAALAAAVGCSPELIAAIVKGRTRKALLAMRCRVDGT